VVTVRCPAAVSALKTQTALISAPDAACRRGRTRLGHAHETSGRSPLFLALVNPWSFATDGKSLFSFLFRCFIGHAGILFDKSIASNTIRLVELKRTSTTKSNFPCT
jgi:hypothetical protein